jgi:hypothetical protein
MTESTSIQQRAAEAQSNSKLSPYKKLVQRALGASVAKPRLLAEDVRGDLVGWGADLGSRAFLARWLPMRDGEEKTAFPQGRQPPAPRVPRTPARPARRLVPQRGCR